MPWWGLHCQAPIGSRRRSSTGGGRQNAIRSARGDSAVSGQPAAGPRLCQTVDVNPVASVAEGDTNRAVSRAHPQRKSCGPVGLALAAALRRAPAAGLPRRAGAATGGNGLALLTFLVALTKDGFLGPLQYAFGLARRAAPLDLVHYSGKPLSLGLHQVEPVNGLSKPQIGIHARDHDPSVDGQDLDPDQRDPHEDVDDEPLVEDQLEDVVEATRGGASHVAAPARGLLHRRRHVGIPSSLPSGPLSGFFPPCRLVNASCGPDANGSRPPRTGAHFPTPLLLGAAGRQDASVDLSGVQRFPEQERAVRSPGFTRRRPASAHRPWAKDARRPAPRAIPVKEPPSTMRLPRCRVPQPW